MNYGKLLIICIVLIVAIVGVALSLSSIGKTPVSTQPHADLDFNYNSNNNTVVVSHIGGTDFEDSDGFPEGTIEVYVFPMSEQRPEQPVGNIALPFSYGDSSRIENVTRNDRVIVIWASDSNTIVLGNHSVSR